MGTSRTGDKSAIQIMGRLNSSKSPAANVRGPHRSPEKMSRLNSSKSPAAYVGGPHRSSEKMSRLNSSKSPAAYRMQEFCRRIKERPDLHELFKDKEAMRKRLGRLLLWLSWLLSP